MQNEGWWYKIRTFLLLNLHNRSTIRNVCTVNSANVRNFFVRNSVTPTMTINSQQISIHLDGLTNKIRTLSMIFNCCWQSIASLLSLKGITNLFVRSKRTQFEIDFIDTLLYKFDMHQSNTNGNYNALMIMWHVSQNNLSARSSSNIFKYSFSKKNRKIKRTKWMKKKIYENLSTEKETESQQPKAINKKIDILDNKWLKRLKIIF